MKLDVLVVATDFSEQARVATDWAIDLASQLGARIVLVHTYQLPIVGFPDGALLVDAQTAARLSDDAQSALDTEVKRVSARGINVEGALRQGDPREEIPALATSLGAGLIVAGSHGRRGVARALLGSMAENLVRSSAVPVVVVHPPRR